MAFRVTFDDEGSTARVKYSGDHCDLIDAMNVLEALRADRHFPRIAKLLVDLVECHGDRTTLEVEAFVEFLKALFPGRLVAYVTSIELAPHLSCAADTVGRHGRIEARVFGTAFDAEAWLRGMR